MRDHRELDRRGIFQYGLVTRRQLEQAGVTRKECRILTRNGVLVPENLAVLRTVGTPLTWEQKLLAACLAAGPDAVASHRSAALVWQLTDPPAPVEITLPYEHHPLPAGTIRHRTKALRDVDRAMRHGVPVTTPARTLLDLGAVGPALVPSALERCLYQRLLTTAALWRLLDDIGGPGRRGVRPLREALQRRALGDERPESLLEPLLARIANEAGVRFEYQFNVDVEGHRYRLDFALPGILLAVEVDGLSAHGTREALDRDLDRQNRLVRQGWLLLRYTYTHLTRRRGAVQTEVLDTIRARHQNLGTL